MTWTDLTRAVQQIRAELAELTRRVERLENTR